MLLLCWDGHHEGAVRFLRLRQRSCDISECKQQWVDNLLRFVLYCWSKSWDLAGTTGGRENGRRS